MNIFCIVLYCYRLYIEILPIPFSPHLDAFTRVEPSSAPSCGALGQAPTLVSWAMAAQTTTPATWTRIHLVRRMDSKLVTTCL